MRSFRPRPIQDDFTNLPLSRQWKYNLRHRKAGLCWHCGDVPPTRFIKSTGEVRTLTRCERCLERARMQQKARREKAGNVGPLRSTGKVRKAPPLKSPERLRPGQQRSNSQYFSAVGLFLRP
jgi:hypothetical protein